MHGARGLCPLGPHVLSPPLPSFPRAPSCALLRGQVLACLCCAVGHSLGAFGVVRWHHLVVLCQRSRRIPRTSLAHAHTVRSALSAFGAVRWHWRVCTRTLLLSSPPARSGVWVFLAQGTSRCSWVSMRVWYLVGSHRCCGLAASTRTWSTVHCDGGCANKKLKLTI